MRWFVERGMKEEVMEVRIEFADDAEAGQFKRLLHRGLNTWESPPDWLIKLHDDLHKRKPPASGEPTGG